MTILGIDPGIEGGWAIVSEAGDLLAAGDLPVAGEGAQRMVSAPLLRAVVDQHAPSVAIIELVGAMPKQGVSSTFKFGRAFGIIEGVIGAAGIPTHLMPPARWKKHVALTGEKEASRQRAIRVWPSFAGSHFARKKDHGRAEAALIALAWSSAAERGKNVLPEDVGAAVA